jgi:hypothetical protein
VPLLVDPNAVPTRPINAREALETVSRWASRIPRFTRVGEHPQLAERRSLHVFRHAPRRFASHRKIPKHGLPLDPLSHPWAKSSRRDHIDGTAKHIGQEVTEVEELERTQRSLEFDQHVDVTRRVQLVTPSRPEQPQRQNARRPQPWLQRSDALERLRAIANGNGHARSIEAMADPA